ncbi:restriction endonuclease subunit S [Methanospirillum stamsii]
MTGFLLDQFEILADAPGGVQRLRELILQLAVTGRLGTGDEGDESAALLLNKIQSEKEVLLSKRKIKIKVISELPQIISLKYSIPKNWHWYRLGDIVFFQEGPGIRNWQFRKEGVKLLNVGNFVNGHLILENTDKYISEEEFYEKYQHFKIEEGDLLFASSGGSWGKTAWFVDPGYFVILNTSTIRLNFYSKTFEPRYLQLFIQCGHFKRQMELQLVGMQPNFGSTHLSRVYIPLPPIPEQKRIVEKVDSLMALFDDLEAKQTQKHSSLVKLGTGSLNSLQQSTTEDELIRWWGHIQMNFGLIFDCVENVKTLRQRILELAVRGMLGTTDDKDEPALLLIKAIKQIHSTTSTNSKINRHLESNNHCNDYPFSIPNNWTWVKFGELIHDLKYGTSQKCDYTIEGVPVLRIPNISEGTLNFQDLKYGVLSAKEVLEYKLEKGDLLFIRSNGSVSLVGRAALVPYNLDSYAYAGYLVRAKLYKQHLSPEFILQVLNSQFTREQIEIPIRTTSGVKNINSKEISRILLPLPPLAEQQRIVKKVDNLMALCDHLEQRLEHRSHSAISLSNATIQQIIGIT